MDLIPKIITINFFEVQDYIKGTPSRLVFSLAGLTTNPGIGKTFQSGYATIVNEKIILK